MYRDAFHCDQQELSEHACSHLVGCTVAEDQSPCAETKIDQCADCQNRTSFREAVRAVSTPDPVGKHTIAECMHA